jgi:hypothetical protein
MEVGLMKLRWRARATVVARERETGWSHLYLGHARGPRPRPLDAGDLGRGLEKRAIYSGAAPPPRRRRPLAAERRAGGGEREGSLDAQ